MIVGNDWLVQYKAHLDFQYECCEFYKGPYKMIVYVNPMQSLSPNSHRLATMQFKRIIWKGKPRF